MALRVSVAWRLRRAVGGRGSRERSVVGLSSRGGLRAAGAAIVTLFLLPIFFVTFLLQNQLLRGVTFGTVKK